MSAREPIRVIIVDDQAIIRSGLGAFLMAYPDVRMVGEASDGEEAIQLCELVRPDVVLMDIKMPNMDGLTATGIIHTRWKNIKTIVLTSFSDRETAEHALEAGAAGFLLKDVTAEELVETIRKVYRETSTTNSHEKLYVTRSDLLESFTHELQRAAPNLASLASLLGKYLPQIFPDGRAIVRIFPDQDLWADGSYPADLLGFPAWEWLRNTSNARAFMPGESYPWGGRQSNGCALIMAPLLGLGGIAPAVGGIGLYQRRNLVELDQLVPTVRSIAEQVSIALNRVQGQATTLAHKKMSQELVSAGKVQANILPERPPSIRGWDLAATLEPAREMSGDFYDFIPMANGKWGLVIADVTDKGMGAALIMALSNTLIRTYAGHYPTLPAFAMSAVNSRILSDTRESMFVTAFFGVLEPDIGRLRYVNAGHNPPYLIKAQRGKPVDTLRKTGMALGVDEEATWQQKVVKIAAGEVLVLYTDGITEAQNRRGEFYGEARLLQAARTQEKTSARAILDALVADVRGFIGGVAQQDDIAIMVLVRKP